MKSSKNPDGGQENKIEVTAIAVKPGFADAADATIESSDGIRDPRIKAVAAVVEAIHEPETALQHDQYIEFLDSRRKRLDAIDDQLLELVARRMEIAGEILSAKHKYDITARDKKRQEQIYVRINALATKYVARGVMLNKDQTRELYSLFIRLGVENWQRNTIDDHGERS